MTIVKPIKGLFAMAAGGTVIACFLLRLSAAILVVVVIPVGLGILAFELERLKRGCRHSYAFLVGAKSGP